MIFALTFFSLPLDYRLFNSVFSFYISIRPSLYFLFFFDFQIRFSLYSLYFLFSLFFLFLRFSVLHRCFLDIFFLLSCHWGLVLVCWCLLFSCLCLGFAESLGSVLPFFSFLYITFVLFLLTGYVFFFFSIYHLSPIVYRSSIFLSLFTISLFFCSFMRLCCVRSGSFHL